MKEETDKSVLYLPFDLIIVVDFMAESAVELGCDDMAGLKEPVCGLIYSFTPVSDGVFIAGNIVDGKVLRNLFCPLCALNTVHHFAEIEH